MRRISLIPVLFFPLFTLSSCHDLSFLFPSSPLKTNLPILPSGIYSLKASIAYPDCPIIAYMTIQELSEEAFQSLNNKNCYYGFSLNSN